MEEKFFSPTVGQLNLSELILEIKNYIDEKPENRYKLIIGTDSQHNHFQRHSLDFITAIVVHRKGCGGRYFWQKNTKDKIYTLRDKIYQETWFSLEVAQKIIAQLRKILSHQNSYELEIHIDIGQNGPTKELIKEVVGMVVGIGLIPKIKPESYGAFVVADRHS